MDLTKLFKMQKVLDKRIEKEHPRQDGEDRLAKKILALQVELGELARNWRGFKFWSNDQEPRTKVSRELFSNDPTEQVGELANLLLEEYVDCLHFILSIGLEIGVDYFKYHNDHRFKESNITDQFLRVMDYVVGLREDDYCTELLQSFVHLGEMLGFTWEQIEQAYISKNEVNHDRQNNNY